MNKLNIHSYNVFEYKPLYKPKLLSSEFEKKIELFAFDKCEYIILYHACRNAVYSNMQILENLKLKKLSVINYVSGTMVFDIFN